MNDPFVCQQCGACCSVAGYVRLGDGDIAALAAALGLAVADFTGRYTELLPDRSGLVLVTQESGACVFYGESGCAVHASKPDQCRGFPLQWRFAEAEAVCPALRKNCKDKKTFPPA